MIDLAKRAVPARFLAWLLLLPPLLALLNFHREILSYPLAHLGTETAVAQAAAFMARGGDPTAAGTFPLHDLTYGFVHSQLLSGAGPALAGSLFFQRCFSALCIAACLAVVGVWARRRGTAAWPLAAVLLCLYSGLLFYCTPHARPDALCTLLITAATALASLGLGPAFCLAAGALAALAFYCKSYGAIAGLMAVAVLLARRQWRGAVWVCAGAFITALLAHAWVGHRFANYYPVIFGIQWEARTYDADYLALQVAYFLKQSAAPLAALLYSLWKARADGSARDRWADAAPCLVALLALLGLGGHSGAMLTYFEQLLLPSLLLWLCFNLPPSGRARSLVLGLLLVGAYQAPYFLLVSSQAWRRAHLQPMLDELEPLLSASAPGKVLVGAELQPWARRYHQELADNDDFRFYSPGQSNAAEPRASAQRSVALHIQALQARIAKADYDWIILNDASPVLVGADLGRYRLVKQGPYHAPGIPFASPEKFDAYQAKRLKPLS